MKKILNVKKKRSVNSREESSYIVKIWYPQSLIPDKTVSCSA